jgi:hypothetical protein
MTKKEVHQLNIIMALLRFRTHSKVTMIVPNLYKLNEIKEPILRRLPGSEVTKPPITIQYLGDTVVRFFTYDKLKFAQGVTSDVLWIVGPIPTNNAHWGQHEDHLVAANRIGDNPLMFIGDAL